MNRFTSSLQENQFNDQIVHGFKVENDTFYYYSIEYKNKVKAPIKYQTNLIFTNLRAAKKIAKSLNKLQETKSFKAIECSYSLNGSLARVSDLIAKQKETQKLIPEIAIELQELRKERRKKWSQLR